MLPLTQDLSFGARAPEVNADVERGREILRELDPHIRQRMKEDGLDGFADGLKQVHLHLHTPDGSLLDGFARIDKVMETTKKYGMPAVGVSEHGTMASHFKFYNAARDAGIKPILGMEAYIAPHRKWKKEYSQVSYEMETYEVMKKDPETGERYPSTAQRVRIYKVHKDDVEAQGLTLITALGDKPVMDTLIPRIDELIIEELEEEAKIAGEKKTKTQLKRGVASRKARHTRDGVRFAVKQKRNVRELFEWRPKMNHLLLIAKDNEGYKNMLTLCSKGFFEGFYYKPRIDYELVKQYGKGIIATSACFTKDALVTTKQGLSPITNLSPGDLVQTHLGNWSPVDHLTTRPYKGHLYTINTLGGAMPVTSTHDHQYYVIPKISTKTVRLGRDGYDADRYQTLVSPSSLKTKKQLFKIASVNRTPSWKPAHELTRGDSILTPVDVSVEDVEDIALSPFYMEGAKYHLPESVKVSNDLLWLLGLYAAEGSKCSLTKGKVDFTIDSRKPHLIQEIVRIMKESFSLDAKIYEKKDSLAVSVTISSIEFYAFIDSLFDSGAFNKSVPQFIKRLPVEKQSYFLKGYFLGDGYTRLRDGHRSISCSTISPSLAQDIVNIFYRMEINPSLTLYPENTDANGVRHQQWYSIELNAGVASELYRFIYQDEVLSIGNDMRRMKDFYFIHDGIFYMKQSITKVDSVPYDGNVYCLNVPGDHSFVAQGLAVHNCLGSDISQCILKGYDNVARNLIKFYAKHFDEFYLEVQPSDQPEQHMVNNRLIKFSEELGLPLICTTDVHMVDHSEKAVHAAFTTIGRNEDAGDISVYDSCYFMSTEEILGKGIPWQAVYNTMVVANKCNVSLDDKSIKYPEYDVPEGYDFDTYLRHLAGEGLFQKIMEDDIADPEPYIERLNYELDVIKKKNISAYFIIVWDYINFAKGKGILVGPGRGSACGSLCSYVLGITNLDPIKYDLLFERWKRRPCA